MKRIGLFSFCSNVVLSIVVITMVLSAAVFLSCAGGAYARDEEALGRDSGEELKDFKDVEGKEWLLSEIISQERIVSIDRKKYEDNNMGAFFTLNFEQGQSRVSGTGAPNRYFGPYTAGANMALSIGTIASTLMAAFIEPEELKEGEYFEYLSGVSRWNLLAGKLELYCVNNKGIEVILVFITL